MLSTSGGRRTIEESGGLWKYLREFVVSSFLEVNLFYNTGDCHRLKTKSPLAALLERVSCFI